MCWIMWWRDGNFLVKVSLAQREKREKESDNDTKDKKVKTTKQIRAASTELSSTCSWKCDASEEKEKKLSRKKDEKSDLNAKIQFFSVNRERWKKNYLIKLTQKGDIKKMLVEGDAKSKHSSSTRASSFWVVRAA